MKKFQFIIYDKEKSKILSSQVLEPNREYIIGRPGQKADISIDYSAQVSRVHAKLIVGKMSVSLMDLGSVNGTFKNGVQVHPNQMIILRNGIEIKFADAPCICEIESIVLDEDEEDDQQQRSRSRSQEKIPNKNKVIGNDDKRKLLWVKKEDTIIKKDNQIWNMGNLNDVEKIKMMKLMGVKTVDHILTNNIQKTSLQDEADLSNTKQSIERRNKELEKQFNQAISQRSKKGFGI